MIIIENNKIEQHVYFVSKLFKGVEEKYHKIDRLALGVVITIRNPRPYFIV